MMGSSGIQLSLRWILNFRRLALECRRVGLGQSWMALYRHPYCRRTGPTRNSAKLWAPLHPVMSKFSGSTRTFICHLPAKKLVLHTGQATMQLTFLGWLTYPTFNLKTMYRLPFAEKPVAYCVKSKCQWEHIRPIPSFKTASIPSLKPSSSFNVK